MRARSQADNRVPDVDEQSSIAPDTPQSDAQSDRRARAGPHKAQLSIVNLLYNPGYRGQRSGNYGEDNRRKESQGVLRSFAGESQTDTIYTNQSKHKANKQDTIGQSQPLPKSWRLKPKSKLKSFSSAATSRTSITYTLC